MINIFRLAWFFVCLCVYVCVCVCVCVCVRACVHAHVFILPLHSHIHCYYCLGERMEKEREKKALKMYADLSEFIFLFIHSLIYLYTYFLLFSYILIVQSKIAT